MAKESQPEGFKRWGMYGGSRFEGQLASNLMRQFDYFGLDYREAWKLLMNDGTWEE